MTAKNQTAGFPPGVTFKYPWRKYQARVLKELDVHLEDNHLHIVAPPGSGKTVLGLEVMLRLGKPTLVLAPTIAIRNQWSRRFCELFLQVGKAPEWISRDIKKPGLLTVSTYQSLHAAFSNSKAEEAYGEYDLEEIAEEGNKKPKKKISKSEFIKLAQAMKKVKIGTVVMDEAHHLKNEWWNSLTKLKDALNPTIVGLTATPPYDVTGAEWERYIDLNGTVDAEITTPELVAEGDLCPHQDYIYLSTPTGEEAEKIMDFKQRSARVFDEIKNDSRLKEALSLHPVWQEPDDHLEWIYTNLEKYSAMLIYLKAAGTEIDKRNHAVYGRKVSRIPRLDHQWMAAVLDLFLHQEKKYFDTYAEHRELLANKLSRNGILEKKQIDFNRSHSVDKSLVSSLSKLNSIYEIVEIESRSLKKQLRMVILADYIRREYLEGGDENCEVLRKIGVVPIFERIRREDRSGLKMGVLTGSLVIIPAPARQRLEEVAARLGIDRIQTSPLTYDKRYLVVNSDDKNKHQLVHLITQIFEMGEIEVLVGTKSLLGEGWDAPCINSVIMASYVGSFVLSNQMRGRAIRVQKGNPGKTGNIWHLACVDTRADNGGSDFETLRRRFKSFVGVSFKEGEGLENGMGRLNLPERVLDEHMVSRVNQNMTEEAVKRKELQEKWHQALKKGCLMVEEIEIPYVSENKRNYRENREFYYRNTIKCAVLELGGLASMFVGGVLEWVARNFNRLLRMDSGDLMMHLKVVIFFGVLFMGGRLVWVLKMFIKYRDISKDIREIGMALMESLHRVGVLRTELGKLKVVAGNDENGAVFCHLQGAATYEKSIFIRSLQEVVGPIENPRYIIRRDNLIGGIFKQRNFHAVPEILGRKKAAAEVLAEKWRCFVGPCKLIYTRYIDGRRQMMEAKVNSLASEFLPRSERVKKWK